jgi:hypothetical protein
MANDNLFSKRNQLIALGGIGCLFAGIFIVYSNRQKKLFSDILAAVENPQETVIDGAFGDWRDVYSCDCWTPMYLKKAGISPTTLDYATAKNYAKIIYDAKNKGLISNNQDSVVSVFNKLKNKADLARVSEMFSNMKYGSLVDYIKPFMESSLGRRNYMEDIYNIVSKLPN